MATLAGGQTDVAFSTSLEQSLAAPHVKEEVCACVCGGGPAVPISSH